MASDYFDSSIEFPELDLLTGLPVGTKPASGASSSDTVSGDDWQKQFLDDSAKALDSGVFVNPMDIATQEENKKLRKQLEDLRAESEQAQAEFREQQDKYVEVLRQLNEKNQADLEEQRVQHEKQMAELGKSVVFDRWGIADDGRTIVRLATSWSTTEEYIELLAKA